MGEIATRDAKAPMRREQVPYLIDATASGCMRRLILTGLLGLAWTASSICAWGEGKLVLPKPLKPSGGQDIVATVAGSPISKFALRKALLQRGAEISNRFESIQAKEAVLRELIRREVLAQAARDAGFNQDSEIQETVSRVLADRYLREIRQLNPGPSPVSSEEITAYYEEHVVDYSIPERVRASMIFLKAPPRASPQELAGLRRRAERLHAEALPLDTSGFARLVQKHSNDATSRRRGGRANQFSRRFSS